MFKIRTLYKPQDLWNVALFVLSEDEGLFDCVLRAPNKRFSPQSLVRTRYHQVTGYADPFLFVHDGWLYLFYEEERLEAPAPICARRTRDLRHWESLGAVLKEPHHLSYPNVFEYDGTIYMLPETRECDAVILYKAVDFPYRWEKYKVLVEGDKFVDSCVLQHNGLWYLFTTSWLDESGRLRLFVSDSLLGEYKEHPLSPVVEGFAASRCGGAMFQYEGRLYRPAQDCSNYYGEGLRLYEITKLSPTEYEERFVKSMIDKKQKWNPKGGHHFNTTIFNGKRVVVMDGIVNDNWINNHTRKFFNAHSGFHNLILYGLIGGFCATLDFSVYSVLCYWKIIPYLWANIISTNMGIITSFFLNRSLNFKVKDKVTVRLLSFYSIGLVGLGVSELILYFMVTLGGCDELMSKLSTTVVVALMQFILNKYITFRKPKP